MLKLVTGQHAVDPAAHRLPVGVLGECGVAGVVPGVGERLGQADALVELANREQRGVAG